MLIDKSKIKLITSSSFDDDGFDCEIWIENSCIIVVSIDDASQVTVIFGEINGKSISYDAIGELLNEACEIVKYKQSDFRKNDINNFR